MSKKQPTMKEMKAELKRLNASLKAEEGKTQSEGGFARVIGYRNDANSDEYGVEYSLLQFVDEANQPIGSPRGDKEAEAVLKQIKAIRWGASKRGKPRFNKKAGAWSIQTEYVPNFVVMGSKNKAGKFTAKK